MSAECDSVHDATDITWIIAYARQPGGNPTPFQQLEAEGQCHRDTKRLEGVTFAFRLYLFLCPMHAVAAGASSRYDLWAWLPVSHTEVYIYFQPGAQPHHSSRLTPGGRRRLAARSVKQP